MHSGTTATRMRYGTLGVALACLFLGAPQASACSGPGCKEGRYGYRQPPRAWRYNGYRSSAYRRAPRVYAYRRAPPVYGYFWYSGLPSTYLYRYPVSGPTLPDAGSTGLTPPIPTFQGIQEGGVPGPGPTLFGPPAPPQGYYGYNPDLGYYSGYAYFGPPGSYTYSGPPPPTAWLERRRRR
jgi:hypothetical protein